MGAAVGWKDCGEHNQGKKADSGSADDEKQNSKRRTGCGYSHDVCKCAQGKVLLMFSCMSFKRDKKGLI